MAIGRSLGLGALNSDDSDGKGTAIPASAIFTHEDIGFWIGLLVTHARNCDQTYIDSMETFHSAVRRHWHRGAFLLMEDWKASDANFDKFIETLIVRRAELPEEADKKTTKAESISIEKPADVSEQLVKALSDIGVTAEIKGLTHGPRITRYQVYLPEINQLDKLKKGLEKLSLILNLQHTIPTLNRGNQAKTISLDVPRPESSWQTKTFSDVFQWVNSPESGDGELVVFPGVDILGNPYCFDLATAPHLLVGGTTGSGKSVCLHSLILSLLIRHTAETLKIALIDPKQVEFSVYQGCDYLYGGDVVTELANISDRIDQLVEEMENRYRLFSNIGVNNITEAKRKGNTLPYIVVFIEELADLILQDDELEQPISRLAQKARAAGIHLVLATQRPDAKTFTGLIRSNIPSRIALTVQKNTESKIILDDTGAEYLLGSGDMLIKAKPGGQPDRVHGVLVGRSDIQNVLKERSTIINNLLNTLSKKQG